MSRNGGFASNKVGADGLTGKERAIKAGRLGGQISTRRKLDTAPIIAAAHDNPEYFKNVSSVSSIRNLFHR